jgi:tetratricopeptide (TPR) repeat protein
MVWKRRVSIILVHPRTAKAAEFLFTFEFLGSFEQYCLHNQVMDELCRSLRWGESGDGLTGESCTESPRTPSVKEDRLARVMDDQPLANKLYAEGMAHAKKGRLQDAIATWTRVLDYSTMIELRGATLFNLGRAYEKLGDTEAAISHYKQSVDANPAQFNALCNIGSLYINQGDYQEALGYLLDAAQRNAQDPVTVNNLVICYEHVGNPVEASEWRNRLRGIRRSGD